MIAGPLARRRRSEHRSSSQAEWAPAADRPDPVELLIEQNTTREPDLVPVRHGRMMVSPFTFYRGAAKVMASDLASTPTAGLEVQLCGDAHLSNFGGFGSPERQLLFGLNDFDETLPGPFEYDLKRMAASFTIAARNNGFTQVRCQRCDRGVGEGVPDRDGGVRGDADARGLVCPHVRARTSKRRWEPPGGGHASRRSRARGSPARRRAKAAKSKRPDDADLATSIKAAKKALQKAHTRDSLHALNRYAESVDGKYRIVSQPPVVVPVRELEETWGMSDGGDAQHRRGSVPGVPENLE